MENNVSKKEFRYGLVNRPAGIGCIPNEAYRLEPSLEGDIGSSLTRHGVVVFERPLTEQELYSFELAVIADDDLKEEVAIEVALKLSRYAKEYLADEAEDPDSFTTWVMDRLRNVRRYRVHVGDTRVFVAMVKARLENVMANAANKQE